MPEEARWVQETFANDVGWPPDFQRLPIKDAVELLGDSGKYPGQMLVFHKLPSMEEPKWKMNVYYGSQGTYTGKYENLENGKLHILNSRSWTVANLVPLDIDLEVPILWASRQEIQHLSYQFNSTSQGRSIIAKDPANAPKSIVSLPGQ